MSSHENLVQCSNLSKKFCRSVKRSFAYGIKDIVSELLLKDESQEALRPGEFWALKNISFELKPGTSLGLVGANGSGKTTLLRVLSGLIKPSSGEVKIRGKVAPLLALGAGFNPILTGRENIYVNLSLLGVPRTEIDRDMDSILDFAEIGGAVDAPLKTYSSGMTARLGFACAIHTHPDLILVDEVLAVGDMKFRTKCYRKLAELKETGTCFVLVSHNPLPILSNCQEALYLKSGELMGAGPAERVVEQYEQDLFANPESTPTVDAQIRLQKDKDFAIRAVRFETSTRSPGNEIYSGENASFVVSCESSLFYNDVSLGVIVKDLSTGNENVLHMESGRDGARFSTQPGRFDLKMMWPYCGLKPGRYSVKTYVSVGEHFYMLDAVESFVFSVKAQKGMSQCGYYQPRSWELSCLNP